MVGNDGTVCFRPITSQFDSIDFEVGDAQVVDHVALDVGQCWFLAEDKSAAGHPVS